MWDVAYRTERKSIYQVKKLSYLNPSLDNYLKKFQTQIKLENNLTWIIIFLYWSMPLSLELKLSFNTEDDFLKWSPCRNLADQLTLFKPGGGQIMPLTLLPDPPDSNSYLHLCTL